MEAFPSHTDNHTATGAPTYPLRTRLPGPQRTIGRRHALRVAPRRLRSSISLLMTLGTRWWFWDLGCTRKAMLRSRLSGTKTRRMRSNVKLVVMTDCSEAKRVTRGRSPQIKGGYMPWEVIRDPTAMGWASNRPDDMETLENSRLNNWQNKIEVAFQNDKSLYSLSSGL